MRILGILFKQNKILNLLAILVSILFFTLIFVFVVNVNQTNIEIKTTKNFEGKNIYQVSDSLIGEKEKTFFKNTKGYDLLNEFNHELSRSHEFTYYTATWQPIGVAGFKGNHSFDPNYQISGQSTPTYELNNKTYSFVLAIQANKAVFDINNLQIDMGRQFTQDEYKYKENSSPIPVLLGGQYRDLYQIGSKINIFLYNKELKGKVIGFLESHQKIMTANQPELILDNYMILPAITFSENPSNYLMHNPKDELFVKASLLAGTDSILLTKQSPVKIRKKTDQIAVKTGFRDFQLIGASSLAINALVSMTKTNMSLIVIAITLLFFITLITFLYTLHLKMKKNIDSYLVLLISGANMLHIKKYVRDEFLLLSLIGTIIPIIPLLILTGWSFSTLLIYLFFSIGCILVISQLIKYYINKEFTNIDIVQHLKR